MIGVLTHHWAKPDRIDEARELLDRNGLAQSKAPGFVSRHTLVAHADPAKITTLVVWASEDRVMPPAHGRRLAELLPRGRLVEVADGYTLLPLDRPAELARLIGEFVRAPAPPSQA